MGNGGAAALRPSRELPVGSPGWLPSGRGAEGGAPLQLRAAAVEDGNSLLRGSLSSTVRTGKGGAKPFSSSPHTQLAPPGARQQAGCPSPRPPQQRRGQPATVPWGFASSGFPQPAERLSPCPDLARLGASPLGTSRGEPARPGCGSHREGGEGRCPGQGLGSLAGRPEHRPSRVSFPSTAEVEAATGGRQAGP